MNETLAFLINQGSVVTFLIVLIEQCGLPVPAPPVLLAMGALVARGYFSFPHALALAVAGSLLGDLLWYQLGKRKGHSVLRFLCRISIEPDSCVRNATGSFERHGPRTLLLSKFIPGLSTVAPPLAALAGVKLPRFLFCSAIGAALWAGSYLLLGFIFHNRLEWIAQALDKAGNGIGAAALAGLATWIGFKFWQRHSFLLEIRLARISPEELHDLMQREIPVAIFDLRGKREFEESGMLLPGARWLDPRTLEGEILAQLGEHREVILYCS